MAVVAALKKTNGDTGADKLITAMEGMSFDTPKGKMTFRKEDHQAMQSDVPLQDQGRPGVPWGVPELVHEIKPEEMQVPIKNKRSAAPAWWRAGRSTAPKARCSTPRGAA
jgi:branched-chain amino acid transport system substrate-binding protein